MIFHPRKSFKIFEEDTILAQTSERAGARFKVRDSLSSPSTRFHAFVVVEAVVAQFYSVRSSIKSDTLIYCREF